MSDDHNMPARGSAPSDEEIFDFIQGTLAPDRATAVAAAISADPQLAALVAAARTGGERATNYAATHRAPMEASLSLHRSLTEEWDQLAKTKRKRRSSRRAKSGGAMSTAASSPLSATPPPQSPQPKIELPPELRPAEGAVPPPTSHEKESALPPPVAGPPPATKPLGELPILRRQSEPEPAMEPEPDPEPVVAEPAAPLRMPDTKPQPQTVRPARQPEPVARPTRGSRFRLQPLFRVAVSFAVVAAIAGIGVSGVRSLGGEDQATPSLAPPGNADSFSAESAKKNNADQAPRAAGVAADPESTAAATAGAPAVAEDSMAGGAQAPTASGEIAKKQVACIFVDSNVPVPVSGPANPVLGTVNRAISADFTIAPYRIDCKF